MVGIQGLNYRCFCDEEESEGKGQDKDRRCDGLGEFEVENGEEFRLWWKPGGVEK